MFTDSSLKISCDTTEEVKGEVKGSLLISQSTNQPCPIACVPFMASHPWPTDPFLCSVPTEIQVDSVQEGELSPQQKNKTGQDFSTNILNANFNVLYCDILWNTKKCKQGKICLKSTLNLDILMNHGGCLFSFQNTACLSRKECPRMLKELSVKN